MRRIHSPEGSISMTDYSLNTDKDRSLENTQDDRSLASKDIRTIGETWDIDYWVLLSESRII